MTKFLMKLDSDSKFHSLLYLEIVFTILIDFLCLQGGVHCAYLIITINKLTLVYIYVVLLPLNRNSGERKMLRRSLIIM